MLKNILQLPKYLYEGIAYHLGGSLFTAKPRMIQFPVCDRCNSRCIMCNRWEKKADKEISIQKIREVFSRDLFSRIEDVSLHGGEPTLRKDLPEICEIIVDSCPRLLRLWISTNGFGTKRIEKRVSAIQDILRSRNFPALSINVSIDGLEEVHDKIRGIKGGFKQCIETIKMLKRLSDSYPIEISMGTVIQPLNVHQIADIERLAQSLDIPVGFQPLMFDKFFSISGESELDFSKEGIKEFKKVIETKLSKGKSTTSLYWCQFLSMMNGSDRKLPCAFDRYVFSLYPTGEVLPCSREDWIQFGNVYKEDPEKIWFGDKAKKIRRAMRKKVCPTCTFFCGIEFSLQKEFFTYSKFLLKKLNTRQVK